MPFYDPKAQQVKGPQQWSPEWGLGSELMGGTFAQPPREDPDQYKQPATTQPPLSHYYQMYGGTVTDPETGDQYHVKLQAPPEPQGNQSWHHGIIEGEWHDHPLARHNNNYFAKLETSNWDQSDDLGNVPLHVLQQNGYIEDPTKLRAKYAGGPPMLKNTFAGLRELPAAFGGEYDGFHKRRHITAPAPLTGKELRPANYAGRLSAPVGAQRIRALPHESVQVSKGKRNSGQELANFSHRVGGLAHVGGSLVDRMRTADEAHLNATISADSLELVRNAPAAGQFDPAQDSTYSLNQVRTKNQDEDLIKPPSTSQLQRITAAREHAPQYSIRRERALEPQSRVSLMRFGREPFQPGNYGMKVQLPAGSTRLSSEGNDPDYTTLTTVEPVVAVMGSHPDETLRMTDMAPASGVIHMVNGFTGAPAASEPHRVEEGVGDYAVESAQYTQPETSVRQEFYGSTYQATEAVDTTHLYAGYAPTRAPETSVQATFRPHAGNYTRGPELFKEYVPDRNPETSVRHEFGPRLGDYTRNPELFKDYVPDRNPETSVRREFGPRLGDYARNPELFKEYAPDRNPETSVRREFGPYFGDYEAKAQRYIPGAGNLPAGRSQASAPQWAAMPTREGLGRFEQGNRGPHGVFYGQLQNPPTAPHVSKAPTWKTTQSAVDADLMTRRSITQTLTNASIRPDQYSEPVPYMLYDANPRTQLYFPPAQ
jgi:hypothetical protein